MNVSALSTCAVALSVATVFCNTALAQQTPQALQGGLERVQASKLAFAYVRPGTNLTRYRTILLKPLIVPASVRNAASSGASPESGESYMLSASDVAKVQSDFAQSMHNVLGSAGYTFVTTPQADTLIVQPEIVKILLDDPVESSRQTSPGGGMTFSGGGGSITIAAVLADGASNVIIAEVMDRNYGSNVQDVNDSTSNYAQAREAFDSWAGDLRDRLQGGQPAS